MHNRAENTYSRYILTMIISTSAEREQINSIRMACALTFFTATVSGHPGCPRQATAASIITPKDIKTTEYQPDDYPYSGSLFATYSLRSYHPQKKYSFQTELLLGVMGPAALAEQGQKLIHQVISYQLPMGWDHQLGNEILLAAPK
jgi:hypothetical protein